MNRLARLKQLPDYYEEEPINITIQNVPLNVAFFEQIDDTHDEPAQEETFYSGDVNAAMEYANFCNIFHNLAPICCFSCSPMLIVDKLSPVILHYLRWLTKKVVHLAIPEWGQCFFNKICQPIHLTQVGIIFHAKSYYDSVLDLNDIFLLT